MINTINTCRNNFVSLYLIPVFNKLHFNNIIYEGHTMKKLENLTTKGYIKITKIIYTYIYFCI